MHKSLKRNHWPFAVVLVVILFGATGAFAANPVALSASYDDATNILGIVFDQPVYNDVTKIIRSNIVLDGDNGGLNPDLTLSGGVVQVEGDTLSPNVKILITLDDQKIIENMVDRNSLKLFLGERAFLNENLEGNAATTSENAIPVNYVVDPNPLVPTDAVYDANTNVFTLVFNKPANTRIIEAIKIAFDDDAGGQKADIVFTSDQIELKTVGEKEALEFVFSPKYQQRIEEADTDNLLLILQEYAVQDMERNTNKVITAEDGIKITYIPENPDERTEVVSAGYDAIKNKLTVEFNEPIITTYKWHDARGGSVNLDAVKYTGITIYDAGIDSGATLSGKANVSIFAKKSLIIEVLPADQRLIETLKNRDQLILSIEKYAISDANGNGCRAFTLDDNISISYTDILPEQTPTILNATYNASKNILDLNFGNVSVLTRGIDTSNVLLTGINFDVGGDTIKLTGGTIHSEKSGRPPFVRHVWIDFIPENEAGLETITDKKGIKLLVDPITFIFEKSKNGNLAITADSNKIVTYLADSTAPAVISAKYDKKEKQCYLTFNKLIQCDKFNPDAITIGGVKLSGGIVLESDYTSQITLDISDADLEKIEELDNAIKMDLSVQIDAGTIVNLDGIANENLPFQHGDTTTVGETIFVGYGCGFWDRSFEAFATLDQLVPTSLRGVGQHCYVYVADDQWDTKVNQEAVDSIITIFETKCPASPDKGIYQLCREMYGEEVDTDDDPRTAIVLLNLRDEFGEGRSDRYETLPKAGYFTTNNELSDSIFAHSNEIDMLYIDSDPIIELGVVGNALAQYFTQMILSHVDPDEEQWLTEGIAAMSEVICGYKFTTYNTLAGKILYIPEPTANNVLTHWTGWEAGAFSDLADLSNAFLFHLYLYEQYGGNDIIKRIATDTSNGFTSIDTSLARWARTNQKPIVTVNEIFDDYAITCFVDRLDDPIYGDKYGFKAIDLKTPFREVIDWREDSEWATESNWSFLTYQVKGSPDPDKTKVPKTIRFNGTDDAILSFQAFYAADESFQKVRVSLDEKTNEGMIDATPFVNSGVMLVVCSKNRKTNNISNYVISRDDEPSDFVELNIFQNASADKVLDIYVSSNDRLYADVPTDVPETGVGEGPTVKIILNGTVANSLTAERFFTNDSMYLYHAEHRLSESGSYEIRAEGQDMAGNDFLSTGANVTLTVRKVLASAGGQIESDDGNSHLKILPKSISNDMLFTVTVVDDGIVELSDGYKGLVYRYGPTQIKLNQRAILEIKYDETVDGAKLAIYRKTDNVWSAIGGTVDINRRAITISVDELGDFRIASGQPETIIESEKIPASFNLSQNYPNPFNPVTTIQYGIPKSCDVSLTIYNILGEQIEHIGIKKQKAGYHKIYWNAASVSSGVYFYKLAAGSFSEIRKMSVLK